MRNQRQPVALPGCTCSWFAVETSTAKVALRGGPLTVGGSGGGGDLLENANKHTQTLLN